ncbi:DUF3710 domain-containing protein [Corynebacterium atypicum]|uniref:DUF3710 domain-containing protein n=1 Tax=Corynebacterium atypicum TaxID=191610 RepID=UPI0006902ACB|nr:DUF3710 domain-containing protein [Corynebacterium atypicum]
MWPFGKKKTAGQVSSAADEAKPQGGSTARGDASEPKDSAASAAQDGAPDLARGDRVSGDTGPFDGDSVDIDAFDFSDFASGILNLGSLKLPLPKQSQVQVEMGHDGPRMLHVVTAHGRITPVAFAAPRSGGQWRQTVTQIVAKMREDKLNPEIVEGPWGREIVAQNPNGQLRIIGIDGPRWMLRFTLAAPTGHEEELAAQARELAARTFVYRGDKPILAGNSLPVAIPKQLADQLQQAMQNRQADGSHGGPAQPGSDH